MISAPASMRAISSSRSAGVEGLDGGADALAVAGLGDPPVGVGAGGDLRAVGDDQHLAVAGQALQAQAHRVGHRAADALVDLVEDHQRLRRRRRGRPATPSAPGRSGPARRPRRWRPGRRTARRGWWRSRSSTRSRAVRAGAVLGQRLDGDAEAGLVELQRAPARPSPPWPAARRRRGGAAVRRPAAASIGGAGGGGLRRRRRAGRPRRSPRPAGAAAKRARTAGRASTATPSLRAMARRANSRSSAFSSRSGSKSKAAAAASMAASGLGGLDQGAVERLGGGGDQLRTSAAVGADAGLARRARAPAPAPGWAWPMRLVRPSPPSASRAAAMSASAFSAAPSRARSSASSVSSPSRGSSRSSSARRRVSSSVSAAARPASVAQRLGRVARPRASALQASATAAASALQRAEGVEQRPVGAGVEQAHGLVLAVHLEQHLADLAQHADAGGLVVDEGAASGRRRESWRRRTRSSSRLVGQALVVETGPDRMVGRGREDGGGHRLGRAARAPGRPRRARRWPGPAHRG